MKLLRFADELKSKNDLELWAEYCGYLNLSIEEFMSIQFRLMEEQMNIWSKSGIGEHFLNGRIPKSIDEFRKKVPLTTYEDYADMLLNKKTEMLPEEPIVWIETTWEGGKHPEKLAPYTRSMIDAFRFNAITSIILASADKEHNIPLKNKDKILFGLASLPYVTGLFPHVLNEEVDFEFLPPVKDANNMSFSQRNREGFKMGVEQGIDLFFGLSSVINYMTENFAKSLSSGSKSSLKSLFKLSPKMMARMIKAKYVCSKENREIMPKDLFKPKVFICAGTDTDSYKESLSKAWGVRPMEIFAGTEPTLVASETLDRAGLAFFPDSCFYEFIPESEYIKEMHNPGYQPSTVLYSELESTKKYEIVISVLKGGAFARYRVGDIFSCVCCKGDGCTKLPLLKFVDRVPSVIDIGGFTRITEKSIQTTIDMSKLPIVSWYANKEYDSENRPFMHMFIEIEENSMLSSAINIQLLREHLGIYFKYFDTDYDDLKKMLGIDPLQIDILRCGSSERYQEVYGKLPNKVNAGKIEINNLLRIYSNNPKRGESYE